MAKQAEMKYDAGNPAYLCGIRGWTPKWLQFFAHIHWFLPFLSIFCLVQGKNLRIYKIWWSN